MGEAIALNGAPGAGGFPLETERLLIRPLRPDDAEQLHQVYGDPEAMRCIPSGCTASVEETARRIARLVDCQARWGMSLWAVVEKASGRVLGDCGLVPVEGRGPEVEVAYRLGRAHWGKGYATEAARACLAYGFGRLKLGRIVAITDPEHRASRQVMEKIGMRFEGPASCYGRSVVVYAAANPGDPDP